MKNRLALLLTPFLIASGSTLALAQETGGVAAPEGNKGTVVKGKVPVAKELLKITLPKPKTYTLPNGLRIFVLEDHRLPTFTCSLSLKAGTLFEPKPGVAEVTATMLNEGTKGKSALQFATLIEDLGANLNARAGSERATLSVSGLSENSDKLIDLLAETLLSPAFPEERLSRIKFRSGAQTAQRNTNANALASRLLSQTLYGETPYARTDAARQQIAAVTREDIVAFHDKFYQPNGAILAISGDVNANAIVSKITKAFADWKSGSTPPALPPADFKPKEATRIYLVDRPNSAQTVLLFGNIAISRTSPDYIPLVVANRILGGGSSGRLFQNLREDKGYTYGAYSSLSTPKWAGTWGASASVRTPVTEAAVGEFFKEFARLQNEPVTADELERAKRSIIGSFARTLENSAGVLSSTLDLVENGLPLDYWDTYPAKVQAVTVADVQRVAKQYLGTNRIQLFAVGERSQIEEGLKKYGTVEVTTPR